MGEAILRFAVREDCLRNWRTDLALRTGRRAEGLIKNSKKKINKKKGDKNKREKQLKNCHLAQLHLVYTTVQNDLSSQI
jgi:hypothetical protein